MGLGTNQQMLVLSLASAGLEKTKQKASHRMFTNIATNPGNPQAAASVNTLARLGISCAQLLKQRCLIKAGDKLLGELLTGR